MPEQHTLVIYTDGSCITNPGPVGWAFIVTEDGRELHRACGGLPHGTNNIAELTAVNEALAHLASHHSERAVQVRTDSEYVVEGMNTRLARWKERGWRTSDRKPVLNRDLWERLDRQAVMLPNVKFEWTRGHSTDTFNIAADRLALAAAQQARDAA